MSHATDLRAEARIETIDLQERELDEWLQRLIRDWRTTELTPIDRALCAYAEKLTLDPSRMQKSDLDALRELGLDDVQLHDAIQVVSYFNYINRIADAVHVDLEPEMAPYPEDHD